MVELTLRDGSLTVDVQGWNKVWALKRQLTIPASAVVSVKRLPPEAAHGFWKGWRVPGTHLPGVIVAGTYYKGGEKHFWAVRRADRAIEIDLRGSSWDRLFVEVDDPDAAIELLGARG